MNEGRQVVSHIASEETSASGDTELLAAQLVTVELVLTPGLLRPAPESRCWRAAS